MRFVRDRTRKLPRDTARSRKCDENPVNFPQRSHGGVELSVPRNSRCAHAREHMQHHTSSIVQSTGKRTQHANTSRLVISNKGIKMRLSLKLFQLVPSLKPFQYLGIYCSTSSVSCSIWFLHLQYQFQETCS